MHAWGISSNSQLPVEDSAAGSCPGQWNRILQMSDEMVAQFLQAILVVSTHLKNISQIGNIAPNRGENKPNLKPPPSSIAFLNPASQKKSMIRDLY